MKHVRPVACMPVLAESKANPPLFDPLSPVSLIISFVGFMIAAITDESKKSRD